MSPRKSDGDPFMRVIINADDLGASEPINAAIFALMSRKWVTSASLLANGPAIENAIKELRHFPGCSFGVHLNVTEYRPLSKKVRSSQIVDDSGLLNDKLNTCPEKITKTFSLLSAITDEWSSQVEKILSNGVAISHLDTHHHVHTLPFLFPALKLVQRRYGIRKVRISKNIYKDEDQVGRGIYKKRAFNFLLRNIYRSRTTDGFTDFSTFYDTFERGTFDGESVEVMVHPGQPVDKDEMELMTALFSRTDALHRIRLIDYHQL